MKKYVVACVLMYGALAGMGQAKKMVVAQDGSGNYRTLQEAFNAVPLKNTKPVVIYVKKGIYKEKLHLDSSRNHVTLTGEDKFNTILTYDDHTGKVTPSGETINTRTSATFVVRADHFTAENLTIRNDAGFTAGQAVGLDVQGDQAIVRNCRIIGNQDILFTSTDNSRQYYRNCYIEGTTDFIFGPSTVWFEQCHIHSRKVSHVTAASTPKEHAYGYVFNDCVLTADSSLRGVSLGRPWRPYASVIYMHCFIDRHIKPEGWANWNNTESYKTARYAEYGNYGPGAATEGRVTWSRQLDEPAARAITIEQVLGGWNPEQQHAGK